MFGVSIDYRNELNMTGTGGNPPAGGTTPRHAEPDASHNERTTMPGADRNQRRRSSRSAGRETAPDGRASRDALPVPFSEPRPDES